MSFGLEILAAVAVALLSDELLGWIDRLSKWPVLHSARQVPAELVERFAEEWQADMAAKPGKLSRLLFALDCRRAAFGISEQSFLPKVSPVTAFAVRVFDVGSASLTLLYLAPAIIVTAACVRLACRGSLLHRKEFVGRGGRKFTAFDLRIPCTRTGQPTRIGMFLVQTRLDMLPRLFNVVRGDMSFVGPAPLTPGAEYLLKKALPDFCHARKAVRPGLTGLAQLHYSDARTVLCQLTEGAKHDRDFIEKYSLALVARILVLTPWHVLTGRRRG